MKPYERYKKTNILWNKSVPTEWKVQRGKSIFSFKKELNNQYQCDNILSLTMKGVVNNNIDNPIGLVPKDYATYQIFQKNDLVFKLIDLENYKTSRVGLVHEQGIMSSAYIRIVNRTDLNHKYFYYQYYDLYLRGIYNNLGAGVRSTLNYTDLLNIEVFIPPREEQDQIVGFLDWKISKINKLIKAKKKQIVLLNEQKQSIINKAVTKGLDDTVPMKDSGVGWIGLIPFNWEIGKIKNYFKIQKRIAGKEGYDVLSVTQNGIRIKDISKNEGQMAMNYSGYQFVYPEDFVMNHMDLLTGYVDSSSVFGVTSPDYRVFQLINSEKCMKEYVLFIFQLCYKRKIFYGLGQGAAAQGRWRLPKDNFYNFTFPLPPLNEQQKIVTEINSNVIGIEKALNAITVELEYIMEYKTVLISSVVTGKVDVRDVVVPDFETEVLEEESETFSDEIEALEVDE